MVHDACTMLKALAGKVKHLCKARTPRPRTSQPSSIQDTDRQSHMDELDVAETEDRRQSPATSEPGTPRTVSGGSEDSLKIATVKAVRELIVKEVIEITEPLLDDITDNEFESLQSDTSLEIEMIADDIAQSIVEEVKSLEEGEAARSTLKSEQKRKLSLKGVGDKIKTFFAKTFAKTAIHRMVAQLKSNFHSRVESKPSVQHLNAAVDSLILTDDGEGQQCGKEVCGFHTLQNVSSDRVLVFAKDLSDFLHNHLTDGMMPEIIPESIRRKASCSIVPVAQTSATMYVDIQTKVWRFLGMMRWWLNSQAGTHSNRVTLALKDTEEVEPTELPEVTEESVPLTTSSISEDVQRATGQALKDMEEVESIELPEVTEESVPLATGSAPKHVQHATGPAEKNKMSVRILVDKLVSRIFKKAKVNCTFGKAGTIIKRLFEKIWAEVEGADLRVTPETFKNLDKTIFKDLCETWGCADTVLAFINLNEPVIDKYIVSSFINHLMTPAKECCAICRFFSSVGKAISAPFRRRTTTLYM